MPLFLLAVLLAGCGGAAYTRDPDETDPDTDVPPDTGDDDAIDPPDDPAVDLDLDQYLPDNVVLTQNQLQLLNQGQLTNANGENILGYGDCDDDDSTVNSEADEVAGDGIDQDCDGEDATEEVPNYCKGITGITFTAGPVLVGENEGDEVGTAIAAGDLDGDGVNEVVVGVREWSSDSNSAETDGTVREGRVYIVEPNSSDNEVELAGADVKITGASYDMYFGTVVSVADVDGDKKAELFVGAPGYNLDDAYEWFGYGAGSNSGGVFVFSGRNTWNSTYQLSDTDAGNTGLLSAYQMAILKGSDGDTAGLNFVTVGDIDGDGLGELIEGDGTSCDILPLTAYSGIQNKSDLVTHHISGGYFDSGFCGNIDGGDVDGDGYVDLLFGDVSDSAAAGAGNGWLVHGGNNLPDNISLPTTTLSTSLDYVTLTGSVAGQHATEPAALGDLDGDGRSDLLFGAPTTTNGHLYSGAFFFLDADNYTSAELENGANILLGDSDETDSDLFDLGGKPGYGDEEDALLSYNDMAIVTDPQCPGVSAVAVGAAVYGETHDGRVFVLSPETLYSITWEDDWTVEDADDELVGGYNSNFGMKVVSAGDVNGDGVPDLLVGAPGYDNDRGAVHVFLGEYTY